MASRIINCFSCGRMLAEIPNGGKLLKEGIRAYCLSCDSKRMNIPDSSAFKDIFGDDNPFNDLLGGFGKKSG
jgi:hypothetical protein